MIYREAKMTDIPRLLEMEQGVVEAERPFNPEIKPGNPTYYDLEALIDSDLAYVLVVEDEGRIIGSGYAKIQVSKEIFTHEQNGYLGFMYVEPEYRGKGINQQVVKKLNQWCVDKGQTHVYLEVYAENQAAIRAYEKAGFEPCLIEMKYRLPTE